MAITIAISNQKGGVSKTTLTFNLAHVLASEGYKTLMIDFDPQGSLTEIVDPQELQLDVFTALEFPDCAEGAIVPVTDDLDLMVGGINLSAFEITYGQKEGRENMLRTTIGEIQNRYDFILIDCPPSLGMLLVNALNAADCVVIPTATQYLSYKAFELLLMSIAEVKENLNPKLNILGVVASMHDNRTLHNREVLEKISEEFDVLGIVGSSTKVNDATMAGLPLYKYDKNHKIAKEYEKIARRLINYGKKQNISWWKS